jgi:hypothetical protein
MARPKDKESLINESQRSFDRLLELVNFLPDDKKTMPGANGEWSVKDVLAHLHAWHCLLETWYAEGMAGEKPEMPAPGYTWKTTPQLNEQIFQDHRNESLDLVLQNLKDTHSKVLDIIHRHSDEELFTRKRYQWTGTTSLGCYLIAATSSHYHWAINLIKKWLRSQI